jgi:membrane protease YdiL (CAAX protease family)
MAFATWLASFACLIFVPLVLVVPYVVYLMVQFGHLTADELASNKTLLFLSILGVVPAHILTIGVAWAVVTQWGRYPFFETLGFSWPTSWGPLKGSLICVGLAVLLLAVGGVITTFLGGAKTQLDLIIESSAATRITIALLSFLTAPFVEELIYRGVLYPAVARLTGAGWAVAIVSVLFAGIHYWQYKNNLGVVLVITILSIVLTTLRATTGSLLPPFMLHLIFNGLQSVFLLLQPVLEKWLQQFAPIKTQTGLLIQYAIRQLG